MTTFLPQAVAVGPGVYAPQDDSLLLIEAMRDSGVIPGRNALDVCTGSGVVAIAAAQLGARAVTAVDICPRAVRSARRNAAEAVVQIDIHCADWAGARDRGPFDVVIANPPYVPTLTAAQNDSLPEDVGPSRAWDAGPDGRLFLDPLCEAAVDLLGDAGSFLVVQSEFADPQRSLKLLGRRLYAEVILTRVIPFGPVLTSRAAWMERTGRLTPGCREEELVVIRAEKV